VPNGAVYLGRMRRYVPFLRAHPAVAVVRLQGIIASGARGAALNDAGLAAMIERAFRRGRPRAVALVINSPGGSPTQSSMIAARIRRLADERKVPVFAFVEDVAASGGYWLAAAADEIWADENSIVGSIGVISAGFGFHEFLERNGVERRVYTSGRSKSMLDPFRPEKAEDVARLKDLQEQIHESFIDHVKRRRNGKLADDDSLFSGQIWVGEGARRMGLVDGIGHLVPKMRERYGRKVRFIVYHRRKPLLARLGVSISDGLAAALAERIAFSRYGL
jgi:serine protease SohB